MIVRSFHATATPEGADAYRDHFIRSVLPDLERIEGYRGAYLLRRDDDDQVELQVLTLWESLKGIIRFTGRDMGRAVVDLTARTVLSTYDPMVTHHEVVVDTVNPTNQPG